MLESSMIVATVPVTDLDRAKRFYADTLGLKVLWENPASVRLGCGGGTELSIFRRGPSMADHTLAHFEVGDIEAVVRELRSTTSSSLTMATARCRPPATSRKSARREGRGSGIRTATFLGFARRRDVRPALNRQTNHLRTR